MATDENKTCYIAQPVGGYNYALVNGMQLNQLNQGGTIGIATLDSQGRLQIVNQNKPLAAVRFSKNYNNVVPVKICF